MKALRAAGRFLSWVAAGLTALAVRDTLQNAADRRHAERVLRAMGRAMRAHVDPKAKPNHEDGCNRDHHPDAYCNPEAP